MQRRTSVTSQASAPGGKSARPGGLQRKDSSGSMTERTFRSPSPNAPLDRPDRPASSHGPYPRYDREDAPPVPALPKDYVPPIQIFEAKDQRRASIEPPARVKSPPPKQSAGRGISLDRGRGVMNPPPTVHKKKKAMDRAGESERADSRSSVNFSRPMSPQNSPPHSPLAGKQVQAKLSTTDDDATKPVPQLHNNVAAPAKKKKKKEKTLEGAMTKDLIERGQDAADINRGPQSENVQDITAQVKTLSNIAHEPSSTISAKNPNETPLPKTKKKRRKEAVQNDMSEAGVESLEAAYPSDSDSAISERSSTTDRPRSYNTRAAGLLAKQPSVVREDREAEEKAEEKLQGPSILGQAASNGSPLAGTPANTSKLVSKDRQHGRSASQQTSKPAPKLNVSSVVRHTSLSPGRAAHFSAQPIHEGAKPPAASTFGISGEICNEKFSFTWAVAHGHSAWLGTKRCIRQCLSILR